jgi:anti-anti-sigma regulatory factor
MSIDPAFEPISPRSSGVSLNEVIHVGRSTWRAATFQAGGGPIAVLFLSGELDMSNRLTLRRAMEHVLAAEPHDLVVDLGRVDFCAVAEASMIHFGGSVCGEHEIRYAVSAVPAHITRMFDRMWPEGGLDLYPSARDAVVALRAAP